MIWEHPQGTNFSYTDLENAINHNFQWTFTAPNVINCVRFEAQKNVYFEIQKNMYKPSMLVLSQSIDIQKKLSNSQVISWQHALPMFKSAFWTWVHENEFHRNNISSPSAEREEKNQSGVKKNDSQFMEELLLYPKRTVSFVRVSTCSWLLWPLRCTWAPHAAHTRDPKCKSGENGSLEFVSPARCARGGKFNARESFFFRKIQACTVSWNALAQRFHASVTSQAWSFGYYGGN